MFHTKSDDCIARAVTVASIGVALWGCGRSTDSVPNVIVRDSAGVTIVEYGENLRAPACTVSQMPMVTIGGQESEEQQLYHVYGASRLTDGRTAVLDGGSQQVRFYDQQGQLLQQEGRSGKGPAEFQNAFYLFVLPGDTIWVGDYPPFQFLVFAPNGDWVRTVRPRPEFYLPDDFHVLSDGRMVLVDDGMRTVQRSSGFTERSVTVVVHDRDGAVQDTIGRFPHGTWGRVKEDPHNSTYRIFEAFAQIDAAGTRLLIGHGSKPEIRVFDSTRNFHLDRIIRWNPVIREVTSHDVDAERQRVAEQYRDLDPAELRQQLATEFSKDRPVAMRFPVFSGLKVGRDGRYWVREYRRPDAPLEHRWLVFSPDGRLQCTATIRSFAELLEFGSDYFLAVDRDSLDVERVVQYGIAPPVLMW